MNTAVASRWSPKRGKAVRFGSSCRDIPPDRTAPVPPGDRFRAVSILFGIHPLRGGIPTARRAAVGSRGAEGGHQRPPSLVSSYSRFRPLPPAGGKEVLALPGETVRPHLGKDVEITVELEDHVAPVVL